MPLVTELPSTRVNDLEVVVRPGLARIGQLRQEFYFAIDDPNAFINAVKRGGPRMDLLTFLDRFPQAEQRQPFHMEWDNFAVIPITTFEDWHKTRIPKATRRGLRKAAEHGIDVRWAELDDVLVQQVTELFNESPVRQGRPFWHYGKDSDAVKEILLRDIERSRFLGAYIGEEFVGFIKLISGRNFARTTLIMSKIAHRNKYPNNALVAKAVQVCVEEAIPYLVYGQIDYGKVGNKSLADFKTNNGFEETPLARYFVPLTLRGRLCLKLGLHHGLLAMVPRPVVQAALRLRARLYAPRNKIAASVPDSARTEEHPA